MLRNLYKKESSNLLYKYITLEKFIDYCKNNNVYADERTLETYEKLGLLFPLYRFVVPKNYIKCICKEDSCNIGSFLEKHPEWESIENLHELLNTYTDTREFFFKRTLKNGNPLDYAIKENHQFLMIPTRKNFKSWKTYKVKIKNKNNYRCRDEEDTADLYYAHWQIFALNELNEMYTKQKNILTKRKVTSHYILKLEKEEKLSSSKINNNAQYFQTVSNYAMFNKILWGYIVHKNENDQFLSEENFDFYKKEKKHIAKKEYKKFSYDKWMEFIKNLYQLYEKYLKGEKIKLSNEVKKYLLYTINLLTTAKELSFEKLNEVFIERHKTFTGKLTDDIFIVPAGLEKIFPSEINELKREAYLRLPIFIKQLNKILPVEVQIPDDFHEKIIATIFEDGYETLFSHVSKIEDFWFNRENFANFSLIAHLRSLIVSIENLGHVWFEGENMYEVFKNAFPDYENLRGKYGTKITNVKNIEEFIKKVVLILNDKKSSNNDKLCGYYLVMTHLARNFFSHKNKIEEELLGNIFLEIYKSAMFTLISLYKRKAK